ncbi:mutS protein homolog 5 isoform X6 [Corythoichthys intestinalis]|uniref:mutS protein homolog 5 isoform X6 n=1 Tax=Corythoichthys intestinalis TaxID=161448 RepID=UPI0025A5E81B|nr:mutS protein homolog 5 isoform X6 [Corythoichthys intestinalis]
MAAMEEDGGATATNLAFTEEEEDSNEILLSVLAEHGQVGLCFYDSKHSSVNYMLDTPDNDELHLLSRALLFLSPFFNCLVIQEICPQVIITSAKQERCMTRFLLHLGSNPEYKPEVVIYPYLDFGLELGKLRLLSAHLPFLPASISERDKMTYLSSCITFDSPLMLRTVGALLKCLDRRRVGVQLEDSSVAVPILNFTSYTLKGVVYIDKETFRVLQIFKSEHHPSVYKFHSGKKEGLSLYGILNCCSCRFGSKLLRQWFLRPTLDHAVLLRRQEVIRFFTSPQNSDSLCTLRTSLQNIRNIPTLLRRMSLSQTKVTDWQSIFKVDFEASVAENRFTIKPNIHEEIDDKKRRLMGLSGFLTNIAREVLDQLDVRIPSCSIIYIPLIGFLLCIPRQPNMVVKEDFELQGLEFMFLSDDLLHYRTQRTKDLDNLYGDLFCDIRDMETAVMIQLQDAILERSAALYKILDLAAELDCLMALSRVSQEYGYTSPKLVSHKAISIDQGRHPLFEVCSLMFVANSYQSLESQGNVKIITGPNSSGKSIYLKQVGLIVFMALIGSNVPAKHAEIGPVDAIFTCMPGKESVSLGLSTFMTDLKQMSQALNSSTGNSLVLIDEFGKGTNTVDGLSLLAATVSHWLKMAPSDVPHVLLATNFHSLLQLGLLPTSSMLSLLTLETALDGDELVFLYQLKPGICQSSYAANVARLAGLPANIVQRGVDVSELYRTGKAIPRVDHVSTDEQADRYRTLVVKFMSLDLDDDNLDLNSFMKEELLPSAGQI